MPFCAMFFLTCFTVQGSLASCRHRDSQSSGEGRVRIFSLRLNLAQEDSGDHRKDYFGAVVGKSRCSFFLLLPVVELPMMDYARKSLDLLTLSSFSKCVTASMSASASVTQQLLLRRASRPKPFRVTNADRSLKKGVMADALEDLLNKVGDSLNVPCASGLVLEEDGTGVDTEEFFTTLPDNTVLMVLEEGQKWTRPQSAPLSRDELSNRRPQRRMDVAKLTFDLYKTHPSHFIGCLNVKATLYGVYSLSYEVRCYEAKKMLKEALRWTVYSMQATGHILLGSSWYMEQLLEEEEEEEEEESPEEGLALHRESPMGRLQSFLLRRATY